MRDIYSSLDDRFAMNPGSIAASTSGTAIDTFGARALIFGVITGALSGAAIFSGKLQESIDASTWTDVIAAEFQTDAPAVLAGNSSYRFGYLGSKRYVRFVAVYLSGTSLQVGVIALLEANKRPVI